MKTFAFAAIVGFLAGIFFIFACGASGSDCTQWEVKIVKTNSDTECSWGDLDTTPCTIPAGWEPFAIGNYNQSDIMIRRCVE